MPPSVGGLEDLVMPRGDGYDGLCLTRPALVPEVQLYLADDAIVLRARLEGRAGRRLAPPFWASAWVGGQAVARYLLDHAEIVAGRRVLDVASGSGLVAIAAALSGAARVTANDIDQDALAAITMNARANNVAVDVRAGDMLDGYGEDAEVILAGDVFYSPELAGADAGVSRTRGRAWSAGPGGRSRPRPRSRAPARGRGRVSRLDTRRPRGLVGQVGPGTSADTDLITPGRPSDRRPGATALAAASDALRTTRRRQ